MSSKFSDFYWGGTLWMMSAVCYMLAYMMLAFVFLLSLFVPPLKPVIKDYETTGSLRSILIITAISSTAISLLQFWLRRLAPPVEGPTSFFHELFFAGVNFGFAYICLFFYSDHLQKQNKTGKSE